MRLIDADALIARLKAEMELMIDDGIALIYTQAAINELKHAPAVDAVEVTRCKDCKHRIINERYKEGERGIKAHCDLDTGDPYELGRIAENDNWFCADAERRKDG